MRGWRQEGRAGGHASGHPSDGGLGIVGRIVMKTILTAYGSGHLCGPAGTCWRLRRAALSSAVAAAVAACGYAHAQSVSVGGNFSAGDPVTNTTTTGVAIGEGTSVTGAAGVSVGTGSSAAASGAVSVGPNASAMGTGAVVMGQGATAGANTGGSGTNSWDTAIGYGAQANPVPSSGIGGATALGANATASNLNSTALGTASVASGQSSLAAAGATVAGFQSTGLGYGVNVTGGNAFAAGTNAKAAGSGDIALGAQASTQVSSGSQTGGNIAIGTSIGTAFGLASGQGALATGGVAIAVGTGSSATGYTSVALGNAATASGIGAVSLGSGAAATASNSEALGSGASASGAGDVALGYGSVAASPHAGATALYGGTAAGTASSVLSVGVGGSERQIQNVAPGVISATSTDAINGSQLFTVTQGISSVGAGTAAALGGGATFNAATGAFTAPTYTLQGVTYTNVGAALTGLNTAITAAQNTANSALAIATNSVQYDPSQAGTGGSGTGTGGGTSVTLNPGGTAAGLHNVAAGAVSATSTDAINGSQLYSTNQNVSAAQNTANAAQSAATTALSLAQNGVQYDDASHTSVTLDPGGAAAGLHNVAAGAVSASSTDAVNGSQLYATNENVANLTKQVSGGTIGLVQQQGGSNAPITVGAQTGGTVVNVAGTQGERRISGVAPGVATTDAVNVGQLNQAIQQAGSASTAQANAYTDRQISGISRRLDAVGAEALAASSLIPNARAQGNVQLAAAAGTYGGAAALALGANVWLSDRLLLNAHVVQSTGSGGRFGASLGATFSFR